MVDFKSINETRKNEILKPYIEWIPDPVLVASSIDMSYPWERIEGVGAIALHGTIGSGKTYANQMLKHYIPRAEIVQPTLALYQMAQACGVEGTELGYQEFKALKYGRERIITMANTFRRIYGQDSMMRLAIANAMTANPMLVIVDNVGFQSEMGAVDAAFETVLVNLSPRLEPMTVACDPSVPALASEMVIDAQPNRYAGDIRSPVNFRSDVTLNVSSESFERMVESALHLVATDNFVMETHTPYYRLYHLLRRYAPEIRG